MKFIKVLLFVIGVSLCAGLGWYFVSSQNSIKISDFNFDRDSQDVDNLFHKGDNWYWMISNDSSATYSIDFMLRHKTSSQYEKRSNMILKVAKVKGKLAGFFSYYPKSAHVWHLLFLMVDQDFRRQGLARKMLKFAIDDMIRRGAIRIDLATRNNNFRAQNLYNSFGFKLIDSDEEFIHMSWYKQ